MAQSDNPFGDLPEWRERRRLQELQEGQLADEHGRPAYSDYPQEDYAQPQFPAGYDAGQFDPQQHDPHQQAHPQAAYGQPQQFQPRFQEPESAPVTHEPQMGAPQVPHYYAPDAGAVHPQPHYDPHQQGYPGTGDVAAYSAPPPHAPQHPAPPLPFHDELDGRGDLDLNGGYADPSLYADNSSGVAYDLGGAAGGQGHDYGQEPRFEPLFQDEVVGFQDEVVGFQDEARPRDGSHESVGYGVAGGAGSSAALRELSAGQDQGQGQGQTVAEDSEYDEDEYEEDDEQRFSWKLAAAVIVTGAVVTGGGVVLYDSFKNGGVGAGSSAPIIKAEPGAAKTAPAEPGGRQFANRDSKLLGRLDNNGGAARAQGLGDPVDGSSRVRSVPVVRVGRDGRLILPKAPEAVPTPDGAAGASDGGASVPGINVVDTLDGRSALGGAGVLPPAVPANQGSNESTSEASAASLTAQRATAALRQSAAPEVRAPAGTTQPVVPVVKNRRAVNRATQRNQAPPPVPSKSEVGTAWRMEAPAGSATRTSPPVRQARAAPAAPRATAPRRPAPAPVTSSGGYVAVLATEPTRIRALQSFAELQQKHPVALRDRVPDVQEADLRSRGLGVMYRIVVGPASSSRGAANAVCSSLKAEGYKGCWVKAN